MRVWIDLANSPHVPLLEPVVEHLRQDGHDVVLTARAHAQTLELAQRRWSDVVAIGGASPGGRAAKAATIAGRAMALRKFARRVRPDVSLSHGSYAQVIASRFESIRAVTMMDYEYQPANHVSFRLAERVLVPEAFPEAALRRFGAKPRKVVRYPGFKEELYLADFAPDRGVLGELGLEAEKVVCVFRPPPDGALYHRDVNEVFDELVELATANGQVQSVLLPRSSAQRSRYERFRTLRMPERAVDGRSLLACADLTIGAGGTMNRESALLGTPTYTVFGGRLAAVDAELIRRGLLHDLRGQGTRPAFTKKDPHGVCASPQRSREILERILQAVVEVGG